MTEKRGPHGSNPDAQTHVDLPASRVGGGGIDRLAPGMNDLELDTQKLRALATDIRTRGLTREQLIEISAQRLDRDNPILSHFVGNSGDRVEQEGGDRRSFSRGLVLAFHLVDQASEDGAPRMGYGGFKEATEQRDGIQSLDALQVAAEDLLASQQPLSQAFDVAFEGIPQDTDHATARFGAGILVLGAMAADEAGGAEIELL